eukprot:CAMPEP_0114316060 /NCGR_PEP_ID=MMETSP0059-20121206/22972_1 /TAXON_ID=36894 /ORGANISM="Pyramimonas parkeae, Strain CCMP726" /LENGTH=301 /DNA_ID=CAMNT_0001441907 /DNA_START=104 /DNA_END=1009 /DNA_ORIENTATION=+
MNFHSVSIANTVRNMFRSSSSGPLSSLSPAQQLGVAQMALDDLDWNSKRKMMYAHKKSRVHALGRAPLTANQSWYESRLEGSSSTPRRNAVSLLQELLEAGVVPTMTICAAALKEAASKNNVAGVMFALRALDRRTPHLPDPALAGMVVGTLLKSGETARALAAAEAFAESGVVPSSVALTELVHGVRDMHAEAFAESGVVPSSVALTELVHGVREMHVRAASSGECTRAVLPLLQRLGKVLIPTLAYPLSNLGALDTYINTCERAGDLDSAQRAKSYVVAHTLFAEEEADGDDICGMPTD